MSLKQTLSQAVSGLLGALNSASNLPVTAVKLALENVIVKELAKYLSQFLGIIGLSLDGSILLSISFCLVAVISYWLMNWVTSLLSKLMAPAKVDSDETDQSEECCHDKDCWCDDNLCCDDVLCCDKWLS